MGNCRLGELLCDEFTVAQLEDVDPLVGSNFLSFMILPPRGRARLNNMGRTLAILYRQYDIPKPRHRSRATPVKAPITRKTPCRKPFLE